MTTLAEDIASVNLAVAEVNTLKTALREKCLAIMPMCEALANRVLSSLSGNAEPQAVATAEKVRTSMDELRSAMAAVAGSLQ
jgi:hypothetical protein